MCSLGLPNLFRSPENVMKAIGPVFLRKSVKVMSKRASFTVTAARNSITVILSINMDRNPDSRMKLTKRGIIR